MDCLVKYINDTITLKNLYTFDNDNMCLASVKKLIQGLKMQQLLGELNFYENSLLFSNQSADEIYNITYVPTIFVDKSSVRGYKATAEQVIDALRRYKSVNRLFLCKCSITRGDAIKKFCSSVQELQLEEVHILEADFDEHNLNIIKGALSKVSTLKRVNITFQNATDFNTQLVNQTTSQIAHNVLTMNMKISEKKQEIEDMVATFDKHIGDAFIRILENDKYNLHLDCNINEMRDVSLSAEKLRNELQQMFNLFQNESAQERIKTAVERNTLDPLISHVKDLQYHFEKIIIYYQEFQDNVKVSLKILDKAIDVYKYSSKKQSDILSRYKYVHATIYKHLNAVPLIRLTVVLSKLYVHEKQNQAENCIRVCHQHSSELSSLIEHTKELEFTFNNLQHKIQTSLQNFHCILKSVIEESYDLITVSDDGKLTETTIMQ